MFGGNFAPAGWRCFRCNSCSQFLRTSTFFQLIVYDLRRRWVNVTFARPICSRVLAGFIRTTGFILAEKPAESESVTLTVHGSEQSLPLLASRRNNSKDPPHTRPRREPSRQLPNQPGLLAVMIFRNAVAQLVAVSRTITFNHTFVLTLSFHCSGSSRPRPKRRTESWIHL